VHQREQQCGLVVGVYIGAMGFPINPEPWKAWNYFNQSAPPPPFLMHHTDTADCGA
jgi:hypothetical protein